MAIGVQRQVTGYERVEGFTGLTWYALLDCGHKAELEVDPEAFSPPRHPRGRHIDCPTCTDERDSQ